MDMKNLVFRHETEKDWFAMENLLRDAFWDIYRPGCSEHLMANRLRTHKLYLADYSFAAEYSGALAGGIFYMSAEIRRESGASAFIPILWMLAVAPELQRRGIGSALMTHTLPLLRAAGFPGCAVFGRPAYYSRFGFEPGEQHGLATQDGSFLPALQVVPFDGDFDFSGRLIEGELAAIPPEEVREFDRRFPPRTAHVRPGQLSNIPAL